MKVCIKGSYIHALKLKNLFNSKESWSGQEKTVLLLVLLCRQEFLEIREIMKIQCIIGPATRSFTQRLCTCNLFTKLIKIAIKNYSNKTYFDINFNKNLSLKKPWITTLPPRFLDLPTALEMAP